MDSLAIREQFDYIPAARERTWGLYVAGVGRRVEPARLNARPGPITSVGSSGKGRVLRDYALVYVTDGQGRFKGHDTNWRRVGAGDVFVLFPGIPHDYFALPGTGWTERWVCLNGELANQWCMHDVLCVDWPVLHVGVHDEIVEGFDRLLEIARSCPPFANQIQAGVTMETLALILKFYQNRTKHSKQTAPVIESALSYLGKHWAREVDFEALAAKLGVGHRHFRRLFQEATGLAPHQYLLNLRLNHAKRLLATLPVAEVAAQVGFSDPLYFSRLFKRKVGVAPTRWH
ncbi:MAG: AraC family transcriptional regulator [Chthoniobacteraceae bacterium]|nr:AraC family transcriptional regulator [Chthoniobacteraceae bacterium]